MATKRTDEIKRGVGSFFAPGEPAEGQPAEPEAPTPAAEPEAEPAPGMIHVRMTRKAAEPEPQMIQYQITRKGAEPEAEDAAGPVIIASPKSHTSSGRLLRRTTYFTPAEWGAILAAAEAETRETGERVTAAEIIRRAVWDYLVKDLDA